VKIIWKINYYLKKIFSALIYPIGRKNISFKYPNYTYGVEINPEAKRKDIQKRLKNRKYFNKKLNRNLKSLQLPLTKKKKLSNFVIKNTFNATKIKNDVKHIKTQILNI